MKHQDNRISPLETLRTTAGAECARRMERDHRLDSDAVAIWLLGKNRKLIRDVLNQIVNQAMQRRNDERRVERALKGRSELRPYVDEMRLVAETLGVSLWYLLTLDDEKCERCCAAAELIYRLRGEEAQAAVDAMQAYRERLEPVWAADPKMTLGEAERRLKEQTDNLLHGLEGEPGAGPPANAGSSSPFGA